MIEIREEQALSASTIVIRCAASAAAPGIDRCVELALRIGHTQLVIDLGERQGGDAELLTVLHRSARRVHDAGGCLAVVCADARLRRLFDITLLSQGFPVYATSEDALAG